MPDNDLTVSFGGDLGGLNASIAQAKANVAGFSPGATGQAKIGLDALNASLAQSRTAATNATASWRENLSVLADLTIVARGAADALGWVGDHLALSEHDRNGLRDVASATTAVLGGMSSAIDRASDSLTRYFTDAAYAERSARLFAQANDGIVAAMGRGILGIDQFMQRLELSYSTIARTEVTAIAAAGGLDQFIAAVNRSGGVGSMKEQLVGFTSELMRIPGLSQESASSIEVMLATIPNYSTQSNDILVNLIQTISKTGDEAVANAKKISDAFHDDKNGGKILGDLTADLKNLDDIQALAARITTSLQPDQASTYFDTIIAKLRQQSALQATLAAQNEAAIRSTPLIGNALERIYELTSNAAEKQKDFAAAVTVATANLQLQKNAFDAINAAQAREADYQKIINDETTRTSQLEQAQATIDTLKGRLPNNSAAPTGSEMDLLVRTLIGEAGNQGDAGMQAVLNVIKNRVATGYGGAQSFTDVITAPRQFSVWNPGDPAGAMAKSTSTDSDVYQRALALVKQMTAGDLEDNTSGATSYYNPKNASPSWGPTMTNKSTIGAQVFGNTPNSPPVANADEQEKINQRLQEQYDKIRQINVAKAGGTASDLAGLDIAQKNLTTAQDAVADAQKLVDAKKAELAATQGGSPTAILAAQKALADAEQSLRDKSVAAEKSAADLKAAAYRDGSLQKMQILNDELSQEQAAYVIGSEKWNSLEKQKLANTRQYQDAQRAAAVDTENAKYDAQQRGFRQEQELIKASVDLYGVTKEQEYAQLLASLAKEAAAEKAHYAALQQLYADDPKQYAKYQMQMAEVDTRIRGQQLQATIAYQQQLVQTYRSSFEQIGSTISSTLMQIIQGQATFRDLMRSVVLNIIQQFIEARIKIVADWLAGQAAQVAATVTGETAKTAATAAGTAARTDLIGAASAVQMAQVAIGVVKSILASAAETFAGIFGFLSPIMGPAAIGPAAAGEATVAAVASAIPSFAVGAWSLPSDMVAQVHAGEMIVPASPAEALRSMLEGKSAAAGSGTANTSPSVHFNVQAMDAKSVRNFFAANSRAIVSAVNDAVKTGSHLGLSKLGKA